MVSGILAQREKRTKKNRLIDTVSTVLVSVGPFFRLIDTRKEALASNNRSAQAVVIKGQ
jgi:hypothetical protein